MRYVGALLILLAIFMGTLLVSPFAYIIWKNWENNNFASGRFCVANGFDYAAYDGIYSEKFGKVKCVSNYGKEYIVEEFNVTKRFGSLFSGSTTTGGNK